MPTKWKVLIISIVIYQFILTTVVLKLAHYSYWLHFDGSGGHFPMKWYDSWGTVPKREAMILLLVMFILLLGINMIVFLRKDPSETGKDQSVF